LFYLNRFSEIDQEVLSKEYKPADHTWDALRIVVAEEAQSERKPMVAISMLKRFIEARGSELSPRYHFSVAENIATYTNYVNGNKAAAQSIVTFLSGLSGELTSQDHFYAYNKLLKLCAALDENACTIFSEKLAPPVRPEHDPRRVPTTQTE